MIIFSFLPYGHLGVIHYFKDHPYLATSEDGSHSGLTRWQMIGTIFRARIPVTNEGIYKDSRT